MTSHSNRAQLQGYATEPVFYYRVAWLGTNTGHGMTHATPTPMVLVGEASSGGKRVAESIENTLNRLFRRLHHTHNFEAAWRSWRAQYSLNDQAFLRTVLEDTEANALELINNNAQYSRYSAEYMPETKFWVCIETTDGMQPVPGLVVWDRPDQYMVSLEVEEDLRMLQGELQDCLKMEDWSENEWDGWKARFSLDPSSAKSELVSRLHRRVSLLTASPSGTYKHCTLIYMSNQEGLDKVSKEREQELARQPQHSPQDRYRMTYY